MSSSQNKQAFEERSSCCSGARFKPKHPPQLKEKTQMKKLVTSTLLTAVAVPFLMAAPAGHKAQNTSTSTTTTKKKTKKSKKNGTGSTEGSTTSTSTSK
jgi:hypothetical protein